MDFLCLIFPLDDLDVLHTNLDFQMTVTIWTSCIKMWNSPTFSNNITVVKLRSSQCAFNLSSLKSNLKKIQAWTGLEPMTLQYWLVAFSTAVSWRHTARISVSLRFIPSSHIWLSYIHIYSLSSGIWRTHNWPSIHLAWQFSYTALHWYRNVMGSSPVQACFFLGCFFDYLSWKHTARISVLLMLIRSSHVLFSYIHIHE